ncbi:MAG: NirD/YgiW/YdeI family stress tolerance protein [Opitutales bacterium]
MKITHTTLSLIAGLSLALSASAQDPYEKADDTYISLSGTVVSSTSDAFVLDYGEGLVTVEMDDWDWYGDAYGILPDDDVTVYGYVDDDLYETTSIEASSVWVEDLDTYFYASGADEEGVGEVKYPYTTPVFYDYDYTVTGKVTSVNETIREFTVDTGTREISVDTWQLGYNPLDDEGFLRIDEGDRVTVYGDLDMDAFDEREISAEALVKLQADVGKGEANANR